MKWKAPKSGNFNMQVIPDVDLNVLKLAFSRPAKDASENDRKRVEKARDVVYQSLSAASALKGIPFAQLMQALLTDHQIDSAVDNKQRVTNTLKSLSMGMSIKKKVKEPTNVAEAAV